jgi:tRNA threonylcarbamoyladenosine modification (KEOPS) complex Cgi121 subunit
VFFEISELGQYVWISGFDAKPPSIGHIHQIVSERFPGTSVQFVDLDKVPGSRYLFVAAYNALKSFSSKHPISRSLAMEILLYVSASRQIVEALKRVGITLETKKIATLAVGPSANEVSATATFLEEIMQRKSADQLLDEWPTTRIQNVRSAFDIRDKELNAILDEREKPIRGLERLAIERSALLAVKK